MRPDPFDTNRSSPSGDREPYAYERERLITERERLRQKYEAERDGEDPAPYDRDFGAAYSTPSAPRRKRPIGRWILRGFGIGIVLL
ncbi:MAG: hypothetical protein EOP67_60395, partial [Sphingomonas sp.]